jgi:hypothetical protein
MLKLSVSQQYGRCWPGLGCGHHLPASNYGGCADP